MNKARARKRRYRGKVLPILTFDELKPSVCREATIDDKNIVQDMIATLSDTINGIGLAAPQIGHNVRVFIVKTRDMKQAAVYVNPEIVWISRTCETQEESCLSYPGCSVDVTRYMAVTIQDEGWTPHTPRRRTLAGLEARVAQHEFDHLFGLCKVATP